MTITSSDEITETIIRQPKNIFRHRLDDSRQCSTASRQHPDKGSWMIQIEMILAYHNKISVS